MWRKSLMNVNRTLHCDKCWYQIDGGQLHQARVDWLAGLDPFGENGNILTHQEDNYWGCKFNLNIQSFSFYHQAINELDNFVLPELDFFI